MKSGRGNPPDPNLIKLLRSTVDPIVLRGVAEAVDTYKKAVADSIERARSASEADVEEVLALTGVNFGPVVRHLLPRLMKFDALKGRWVPDLAARGYVKAIESIADQFEAQKKISEAETQVIILALGLVPILAPESLLLRVIVNAAFAADVAVNTIPDYIQTDAELKFALGAIGVLGSERLNVAEAQKVETWALVVAKSPAREA